MTLFERIASVLNGSMQNCDQEDDIIFMNNIMEDMADELGDEKDFDRAKFLENCGYTGDEDL